MANNASAEKAWRQSERHRLHNRYYAKTTRNAIRDLRNTSDKKTAEENAPK
ncbi:MAG: 30S ribosomal protein S20, partial [Bacteroidales bacterium]|nr:30S ribosomal protein S20 [Bacteroidales bacterium]